ncbi:MAG: zinc ABC transporter substrate-binding protein [Minwuia sp.]|nr:zinc ABC transporter substrate-binding protein [Minwuia sp.]
MASTPGVAQDARLRVSASILPVHDLVRAVMHDPARPDAVPGLILPAGASPHSYALKPSEARALSEAAVVFRIGPDLEAFLDRPLANLASDAIKVDLVETPGLIHLPIRDDADFERHDHGKHEGHGDEGKEHAEHDHDKHDHEAENHAEHGDPHIWLHPANAIAMVGEIARTLSEADPDRAPLYRANAQRTVASLKAAMTRLEADWQMLLSAPEPVTFVVFHDSLQYFERWSGVASSGSITLNPEVPPGARHMQELRQRLSAQNVRCVFVEPQLDGRIARQIAEDAGLSVHVVDPIGSASIAGTADHGAGSYIDLIGGIRDTLGDCYRKHTGRSPFGTDSQPTVKD